MKLEIELVAYAVAACAALPAGSPNASRMVAPLSTSSLAKAGRRSILPSASRISTRMFVPSIKPYFDNAARSCAGPGLSGASS